MTKGAAKPQQVPTISRVQNYVPRPNAEHDSMTPSCRFCEDPHLGMLGDNTVMLRGSFVFNPVEGMPMFVLDPDVSLTAMLLPNGQTALVFDVSEACSVTHTECINTMLKEVGLAAEDDDIFEDDDEVEEIDEDEEL